VVDPEAVDGALADELQHQPVGRLEDRRVLHAQAGERVDREEPAVVEVGVRAPPVDELVVLAGVDLLRRPALGAGRDREAVVVVVQLPGSAVPTLPTDDLQLGQVLGRTQHGDPYLPAAELPVDVERGRVGAGLAVLQDVPPPRGGRRVRDPHVVGDQVEHQTEAVLVQRGDEAVEAVAAPARLVDVRMVDGVVPVVAALRRPQQGRGVRVRHPEVGQVAGDFGGVLEAEPGVDLQPVGGRGDAPAAFAAGNLDRAGHSAGPLRTTIDRPWTVTVSPGLTSTGSTSCISAVSSTVVQPWA
jgi:hypothetical protein